VLDSIPVMPIRHPDYWLAGHVRFGEHEGLASAWPSAR